MRKILRYLSIPEWGLMGISVLLITMQVWLDLKLPDYMKSITNLLMKPGSPMGEILTAGGYMLLCAFGSFFSSILVASLAAKIAASFSARLRSALFEKVESFSMEELSRFSTASLITRSTNDVTQVQMLVVIGLQMLIKSPILVVWALLKITQKSWQWSLSTGVAVGILLTIVGICMILAIPRFKKLQKYTDDLNRVARENLTGIRIVRAYNAEKYQEEKFEKTNETLTGTHLYTSRVMAVLFPSVSLVMSGLTLAIYWIGAELIQAAGLLSRFPLFSDMIVYSAYAMQIVMAFMMLVMVFILLPRASVSARRIREVLDSESEIRDGAVVASPEGIKGEVEFRNVCFRYPGAEEYVLKDISFAAKKGETVGVIGSTGCGKSTLVNLLPRLYDATSGEILIDRVNVKDYTQRALRNKLGYVSQQAVLFKGTVASNVAYGSAGKGERSSPDVVDAVDTAQAAEFVEHMEGAYDGYIAPGGTNLSGGQKQRLSIARAVCKRPEIFVFDDAFSALDYKTDRKLRSALKRETAGATSLIVAQRIGTIKDADRIIVLKDGRIEGNGTHEELMRSCDTYREIAYSQLSKEELA